MKNELKINDSVDQTINNDDTTTSKQSHYYGTVKKISDVNDISYISRGSVYFLKDNPRDPDSSFHPYIVIQSMYLDKIGKITVFGITSTPTSINMIPIVMKNSIGYIDPHHPYTYKIDDFYDYNTRYIGNMVNQKAFDIATNFYGLYLGLNLNKTQDEIIKEYIEYVEDFKIRTKDLTPYRPRNPKDQYSSKIKFTVSFGDNNQDVYDSTEVLDNDECEYINDDQSDTIDNQPSIDKTDNNIVVSLNSHAILSMIKQLEIQPYGSIKIPKDVTQMTKSEIEVFVACILNNGALYTSKIYNCSTTTIYNKYHAIKNIYNLTIEK